MVWRQDMRSLLLVAAAAGSIVVSPLVAVNTAPVAQAGPCDTYQGQSTFVSDEQKETCEANLKQALARRHQDWVNCVDNTRGSALSPTQACGDEPSLSHP